VFAIRVPARRYHALHSAGNGRFNNSGAGDRRCCWHLPGLQLGTGTESGSFLNKKTKIFYL
jgi:hypothetical protein